MKTNKDTIYKEGYRPRIVFARVEVSYYPERLRELAKSEPSKVRKKVRKFISDYRSVVVDDSSLIPTIRMRDTLIEKVWPYNEESLNNSFTWISNIEIMKDLSRVNYNFNQKQ